MKIPLLQNSHGKSSASFTFAFIGFNAVILWLLLYILCPIFGITTIPAFNGADAMMLLTPLLMNYFVGKIKDGLENNHKDNSKKEE